MKLNLACWRAFACSPPYLPTKKSRRSLTLARPIPSLDIESGTTPTTPHCATKSQHTTKPEGTGEKNPHAGGCRSDSVREMIQRQPSALEDVLERRNDLEREYIWSAVVSGFENDLSPNIILRACFVPLPFASCVWIDINDRPGLADF